MPFPKVAPRISTQKRPNLKNRIPGTWTLSSLSLAWGTFNIAYGAYPIAFTTDYGQVIWTGSVWVPVAGPKAPLTYGQLIAQYTSANVVGNQNFTCSDVGPCVWQPTINQWLITSPFVLAEGGVAFGWPPAGTIGSNGALTFGGGAVFIRIYNQPGIYLQFPAGAVYSGSPAGWYWTIMSSTSAGVVYPYMYQAGQPAPPASPAPFSGTTGASYTPVTGAAQIQGIQANLPPGGVMGLNGSIQVAWNLKVNNSANGKPFYWLFGNNEVSGSTPTTSQQTAGIGYIRNCASLSSQIAIGNSQGDVGAGYGEYAFNVNSDLGTTVSMSVGLNATTDWAVIESFSVVCFPSMLADFNVTHQVVPASASIVPNGAKALGYKTNAFFLQPQLSDVSYSNAGTGALFAVDPPVGTYNTSAVFSTVGGLLSLNMPSAGTFVNIAGVKSSYSGSPARMNSGTLPTLPAANGFYYEAAVRLSSNNQDHWPAVWMIPAEHNGGFGDQIPGQPTGFEGFIELDAAEAGYSTSGNVPFLGIATTTHVWSGIYNNAITFTGGLSAGATSGTLTANWAQPTNVYSVTFSDGEQRNVTFTNGATTAAWSPALTGNVTASATSYFANIALDNAKTGMALDLTVEHVIGVSYDPIGKTINYWLDGALTLTQSTVGSPNFDSYINPYHYYPVISAQTHGANVPYSLYVRYMAGWTP